MSRIYSKLHQVFSVFVIFGLILGAATPTSFAFATPQDEISQSINPNTINYGSNGQRFQARQAQPVPLLSAQVAAQEEPPVEPAALHITASPAIYLPGKTFKLHWNVTGYEQINSASDVHLVIDMPKDVIPDDPDLAKKCRRHTLIIPYLGNPDYISWTTEGNAQPPFEFTIKLYADNTLIDSEVVVINGAKSRVEAGKGGKINAMGGKVRIDVPAGAINQNLVFDVREPGPNKMPAVSLSGRPVEVIAAGETSEDNVNEFSQPITLQINYQEDQIFNWNEADLMIFYYDEETYDWFPLPTTVDTENNLLTAQSTHLTVFDYKASTWQANSLPTVDAFKVSGFTGAGTYNMDFWTFPGAGGLQPQLSFSYNSQLIDESSAFTQPSWVGMGWALDTGAIVRNMHETNDTTSDDTFTLTLNGFSSLLLPVNAVSDGGETTTTYRTADESFFKIEYYTNVGNPIWTVWGQDGTKYTFNDRAKTNNTSGCVTSSVDLNLIWRWSLSSITNTQGKTLTYTYFNETKPNCVNVIAVYPDTIIYPNGKYRVKFLRDSTRRTDYQTSWTNSSSRVFYGTYRLSELQLQSYPNGSWVNVKRYVFSYSGSTTNQIYPNFIWSKGGRTLTLVGVQEIGMDGSAMPAVTFSYNDDMHMDQVDNGQGGQVKLTYQRWFYYDDTNDDLRSLLTIFGDDECNPYAGIGTAWTSVQSTVGCNTSTNYLQVGIEDPVVGIAHRSIPEHVVKPGGRYWFFIQAEALDGTTDINWGFVDTGTNASEMLYSDNFRPNVGESLTGLEDGLWMPVSYNPSKTKLRLECDDCLIERLQFALAPMYYRVIQKDIIDLTKPVDGQGNPWKSTYTYDYDNASPNTAANSSAVAAAGSDITKLYTYPLREFRGHTLTQEINPEGLANLTWYYQSDGLRGRPYRTVKMQSTFSDFGGLNTTNWSQSGDGAFTNGAVPVYDFDAAKQITSANTTWSSLTRASSVSEGDVVITHVALDGANTQGKVGLSTSSGKVFEVAFQPQNGQYAPILRSSISGTMEETPLDIGGNLQAKRWYGVMFIVGGVDDFQVRIWSLDNPDIHGEIWKSGSGLDENWTFHDQVSNGTIWIDAYLEGRIAEETETFYSLETRVSYTNLSTTSLHTYKDLNVLWVHPVNPSSVCTNHPLGKLPG